MLTTRLITVINKMATITFPKCCLIFIMVSKRLQLDIKFAHTVDNLCTVLLLSHQIYPVFFYEYH